jgi:hypothetical protein
MTKQRRILYNSVHANQFSIYQNTHLWIHSSYRSYFLGEKLTLPETQKAHIDLTTQSVSLAKVYTHARDVGYIKKLQKFTSASTGFYFRKLKFTGKGYKVKKSRLKKSFKLYFGRSHRQYLFSGGLRFKKLSKYRLFLISNNKKKLNRIMWLTLSARPLNKFTKRGLRCTRQFILKRPGKKSTY